MVEKSGMTAGFFTHGRLLALAGALALSACGGEADGTGGAPAGAVDQTEFPRATQIVVPADLPDCSTFILKPKEGAPQAQGGDEELVIESDEDRASLDYTLCAAVTKANAAVAKQDEADKERGMIFADGTAALRITEAREAIEALETEVEGLLDEAKDYSDLAEQITRDRPTDDQDANNANAFLTGAIRPEKVADTAYKYVRIKAGEDAAFQARYDAAAAQPSDEGLSTNALITYGILALLAIAALGVGYAFVKGRSSGSGKKKGKSASSKGERNRSAQPAATPEPIEDIISRAQHEAEMSSLRGQISALEGTITTLTSQLEALKSQPSPADRRRDPQADAGRVESTGGFGENRAAPAPPPTPPVQPRSARSFAESPEVLRLIEEVNTAGKVALNRGGPTDARVETYANDRTNALEVLFASDTDRFWLMPNPDQPGEAALIPGLNTKSKWGNFKTAAPDHPLAHHFDLAQGDRFAIHRAATVRKDASGQWVLVQKGQVSGVS